MSLYNTFWEIKTLPPAHVTTWRVLENKIATKVNLTRRGVVVDSMYCCLCVVKEDTLQEKRELHTDYYIRIKIRM